MKTANTSYCRKCKKIVEVLGFERDDPVLSCGHTKRREKESQKLDALRQNFVPSEELLFALLGAYLAIRKDQISYCPVCDDVVSVIENNGTRFCGGNLIDNPGCGCTIKPIQDRLHTPLKCG